MFDRILSLFVVIAPTAFALVIEIVDERIRKHPFWKYGVVLFGILLSTVTYWQMSRQDAIAASQRESAIERVASETSKQVTAAVGSEYQAMITELTMQIQGLKDQLSSQSKSFADQLKQTDTELNGSISKVGTAPVRYAQLQFRAWPEEEPDAPTDNPTTITHDQSGVFAISFSFTNTSDTPTGTGDVWVYICSQCQFSEEPPGFDRPNGINEKVRHTVFQQLNPGVTMQKQTVKIKITGGPFAWTDVLFNYSCGTCGKVAPRQSVRYKLMY